MSEKKGVVIKVKGAAPARMLPTHPKLKSRANLAIKYISSAALFARKAFEIEKLYKIEKPPQAPSQQLICDHSAYAIGSILTAFAFLEAVINNVFLHAAESKERGKLYDIAVPFDWGITLATAEAWESGVDFDKFNSAYLIEYKKHQNKYNDSGTTKPVEFWNTLDKYQCMLSFSRKCPIW